MNLAALDAIISLRTKTGHVCPKCGYGMDYHPVASSSIYVCRQCPHTQFAHPKRGRIKVAKK